MKYIVNSREINWDINKYLCLSDLILYSFKVLLINEFLVQN